MNPSSSDRPVAIVTGASSGIGYATALHLAGRDHRVLAVVRSEQSGAQLVEEAASRAQQITLAIADVRDDAAVSTALAEAIADSGRVDLLVNSAGIAATSTVEDTSAARYAELFDVNVNGTVRCIQAVLPTMRRQGAGAIVNISSNAGRVAMIAQSAYVASKWALEGLSECLAAEVAQHGIRVAIVEPGVTKSPILGKETSDGGLPPRGGPYDVTYRRMLRYYKRAAPHAAPADEVARAVWDAAYGEPAVLRHACSYGGQLMVDGRARMTDEEWVAMNALPDDESYYDRFQQLLGLPLR